MAAAAVKVIRTCRARLRRVAPDMDEGILEVADALDHCEPLEERNNRFLRELEVSAASLRDVLARYDQYLEEMEEAMQSVDQAERENPDLVEEYASYATASSRGHKMLIRGEQTISQLRAILYTNPNPTPATQSSPTLGDTEQFTEQFGRMLSLLEARDQNYQRRTDLPKLPPPQFDGDLMNWKPFWDRFESSVDQRPNLFPVDKMNYLIGFLTGPALKCVSSLALTNENYPVAVKALKDKYGRTRDLVSSLYKKIREMPAASCDVPRLSSFCTNLESYMGSLEALGENPQGENLIGILIQKLPANFLLTLENAKDEEEEWTVDSLRKAIKRQVKRIESTARSTNIGVSKAATAIEYTAESLFAGEACSRASYKEPRITFPKSPLNVRKTSSYSARKTRQNEKAASGCVYCSGAHYANECRKYSTAAERYAQLGKRCFVCLSDQHKKSECRRQKKCYFCDEKGHHQSLCGKKFAGRGIENSYISIDSGVEKGAEKAARKGSAEAQALVTIEETAIPSRKVSVMLQTARTTLRNPATNDSVYTQLLLDPGSSRTYMSLRMARRLSLKLELADSLDVNRFASRTSVRIETYFAEVKMKLRDATIRIPITVVPCIANNFTRSAIDVSKVHSIAEKLPMADTVPMKQESEPVDFLIGSDYYWDIVTGERLMIQDGLYLIGSRLGWILSGRVPSKVKEPAPVGAFFVQTTGSVPALAEIHKLDFVEPDVQKSPDMTDLWALEAIGIEEIPKESDDECALRNFAENITVEGGRYFVTFPFREGQRSTVPDNYRLSLGRLMSNVKKLKEKPDLLQKVSNVFAEQVKLGIIEAVEKETKEGPTIHYLPHHAVVSEQKETTKVRVVYDGSSRARRDLPSLNETLLKGPTLLENICGILLRLRHHPIAVISDIEKAYLQVGLNVKDRDVTRFLWLKDPELPLTKDNLVVYRFCRVPFGINCSAFLLAQVITHHLTTRYPDSIVAKKILDNNYVDNCITGVNDNESARQFYARSKEMFQAASMNLTQWISNSSEVMKMIPQQDQSKKTRKVLGIGWDPATDLFSIKCPTKSELQQVCTKRQLLKVLGSIFDPLGLIAPAVLKTKLLLQKVTQDKFHWDEKLSGDFAKAFEELATDLAKIEDFKIPRYVGQIEGMHDLICFTDASGSAYATAIYLRIQIPRKTTCRLVFAKTRLNPIKKVSIPGLELLGIVIGCRALKFVAHELRLAHSSCTLFSDSQTAIAWVKADGRQDTWTRNRVKVIRGMKGLKMATDTTDNPADFATRGIAIDRIPDTWWRGPDWILRPKEKWPSFSHEIDVWKTPDENKAEISLVASEEERISPFGIDPERISTLQKLLRVTALCSGFVSRSRRKSDETARVKETADGRRIIMASAIDMKNAMKLYLQYVQAQFYSNIMPQVRAGKKHEMMQLGLMVKSCWFVAEDLRKPISLTQLDYQSCYTRKPNSLVC